MRAFSYSELAAATGGFHPLCIIGEGGFGKVYRAMLHHTPVAIKVMDSDSLQGKAEFDNEVALLGHRLAGAPHLARLLGTCRQQQAVCLVYELMPCGNLEERLCCRGGAAPLSWQVRVRAAAQAAAGLAALHAQQPSPILHRDIKPANIFLDAQLNAHLGDMGLAATAGSAQRRASRGGDEQQAVGDWPYLAPEYRREGRLSTKTDTYAFGLVLLQLLSGRERPQGLADAALAAACQPGLLVHFLDNRAGAWDTLAADRLLRLALWCTAEAPDARPAMSLLQLELAKLWRAVQDAGEAAGPAGGASAGALAGSGLA